MSCRFLRDLLACPMCKGAVSFGAAIIQCTACHREFPQASSDVIDLLPVGLGGTAQAAWQVRQDECDRWYRNLIASPRNAVSCLRYDYDPHAPFLTSLAGVILDVGGGVGITRDYLAKGVRYVSLDPSLVWLDPAWRTTTDAFPSLRTPPCLVRGVGESLPFRSDAFDAVLSFWSLNHVRDPAAVLREMHRVLQPGGRLLLVLEDMPPAWRDFLGRPYWTIGPARVLRSLVAKAGHTVAGRQWPLQSDHIRIEESDIRDERAFDVLNRTWRAGYLTFELRRGMAAAQ